MARVYAFRSFNRVFGFSFDQEGINLPHQYGPWTLFKTIELFHDEPYQGVDVTSCLDDLREHGFHLTASHQRITHLTVKKDRALVLGGGGATGNAWLIGIVIGLLEGGLNVTGPDLMIGTSAGSTTAAQVTSADPSQLFADIMSSASRQQTKSIAITSRSTATGTQEHLERTSRIINEAANASDMRRTLGVEMLAMDESSDCSVQMRWRETVASRLPMQEWPQRLVLIPAVDAQNGEPVVFHSHSGVSLADAVAASCAGGFAYSIGDKRYIDGGYRADVNADLAVGYKRVLIIVPLGDRTRKRLDWNLHLTAQVDELRRQGSQVKTIFPDIDSQHALGTGTSIMDVSRRGLSAQAGNNQGRAIAEAVSEFWR